MTISIVLAVLFAAFLHALWNLLIRKGDDKALGMAGIILGHMVIGIPVIIYVGLPPWEVWPLIIASGVFHVLYPVFLLNAYRIGELTQIYPIARGTALPTITLVSIIILSVELSPLHLIGIAIISATIIGHGINQSRQNSANLNSLGLAILTGLSIAGYSVIDGIGTRMTGSALSFYAASAVMTAIFFVPYLLIFEKGVMSKLPKPEGLKILALGGAISYLAYSLVLWAVLSAPIAVVSSLRETSVIFALILGTTVLKERLTVGKVVMTVLILFGGIILGIA